MRRGLMAGLVAPALLLALAGCSSNASSDQSDTAKADNDMDRASREADAGLQRLGDAASAAAAGAGSEGKVMLRKGRRIAADAANEASADASQAAKDLSH
jgi:hypothetical protein